MNKAIDAAAVVANEKCDLFAQIDRCATDRMVHEQILLNPDKKVILDQLELFTKTFFQK